MKPTFSSLTGKFPISGNSIFNNPLSGTLNASTINTYTGSMIIGNTTSTSNINIGPVVSTGNVNIADGTTMNGIVNIATQGTSLDLLL